MTEKWDYLEDVSVIVDQNGNHVLSSDMFSDADLEFSDERNKWLILHAPELLFYLREVANRGKLPPELKEEVLELLKTEHLLRRG